MIARLPVPRDELKRVADANVRNLAIARQLVGLAETTDDSSLAEKLLDDSNGLVDAAQTIHSALRTAVYLADVA
jgi:hypothetical protein